ncbi:hypothetical protein D3C79_767230 [compost metagenome]
MILLLQVQGQAFFCRFPPLATVELVPGHLEGQPLLGPVTREPGDEVAFGALLHLLLPHPHGAPGIVVGRAGGTDRGIDQFLVDALPGRGGEYCGRRRGRGALAGTTAEGQQKAEQQEDSRTHATASLVEAGGVLEV